ncbi:MAG TPA: hypothetical protein IAC82_04255 [Candidatus Merdivicinus intestinigallinarum]|nr:hypothetical protein [Candidatus Merdivicinus intestinigallinarum]
MYYPKFDVLLAQMNRGEKLENSKPSFCKQNDGGGSSPGGLRTAFFLYLRARGAKG